MLAAPDHRSRRVRIAAFAAVACIASIAVVFHGLPTSGDVNVALSSASDVQVCTDINFGGTCKAIGYGRYPAMSFVGVPNDSISSIKIPSGAVVVLYEHDDFKGAQIEFKNDVKNLVDFSWNDRASSIVVQSSEDRKRQEEAQIFQSVMSNVVTAEKANVAPKTCDTCCPPAPNPLIMPPASCSDVAIDLKSISNTLDTLTRLIRSQHLSDLCKVAGSIKPSGGTSSVSRDSVVPNTDIAQKADDLKSFVESLLQQSNARVAFDASAQSAAAVKAKLDEEKAKVDALQKKQDEIEKKMRDEMAALANAQAAQKIKDEQAKKDAADAAARAQKVKDDEAKLKKEEDSRRAEKDRLEKEAADLKAKELRLQKEKAEQEAALAAAKAKMDADRKAQEKAAADAKAAQALKIARDAQIAADAAAFAATPPGPAKDSIQKRIVDETQKAKDATQAITDAKKILDNAAAKVIDNQKVINTLTDNIPKTGGNIADTQTKLNIDTAKLQQESPYLQGLQASIFRLTNEPRSMPDFAALRKSSSELSTPLNSNIDFRDFSNSFVQRMFGFSTRFGMTLTGFLDIPFEDVWHIFIESDDGSKVFVDGSLLVDNDGLHAMDERKGSRFLTKGKHPLLVEFSQWDGGGGLVMRWMSSKQNQKEIIPATAFYVLSPKAPAPLVKDVQKLAADELLLPRDTGMTGGNGGARPLPSITVNLEQKVDDAALILAQKAQELKKEQDRLAKLAADAQAAKEAADKAAAATAQAAAAKKIADDMAKEEQRKKDEAAQAKIAADSKKIDELKKAEAEAAAKVAAQKAVKDLADARAQQEARYAAAVAEKAAFYENVADYASNLGSVISGQSIEGETNKSPLQCAQACNSNAACIAFTTTVQPLSSQVRVPSGLLGKFYSTPGLISKLPQFPVGSDFPLLKEAPIASLNYPPPNSFASIGLDTRFIGLFTGFLSVPSSGKWSISCESDDGSKVYIDDILLIDNDGLHPPQEKAGSVELVRGSHSIRVEFFNAEGGSGLILRWSGPNVAKQVIPSSAFTTASTTSGNHCNMYSSYKENSLSPEGAGAVTGAATYILARATAYESCNFGGNGVSVSRFAHALHPSLDALTLCKLSPGTFAGRAGWAVNIKSIKIPQGSSVTPYTEQQYQGSSKLLQSTQSCLQQAVPAKSYVLRSPNDEKARLALEAAQAKKAEEDAIAAAAKKAKDEAAANAAAAAKKLADEQAKAKKDAADLLALKTERKRLQINARNIALAAAKAKRDGHKYQMDLAEKNLKLVLEDEAAALRKYNELGDSHGKAKADLEAVRIRNKQAIQAFEEAKRLHAAAVDEYNARAKELSDDNERAVESF